ncbi:MAG: hypothetical protein ISS15_00985 [Alphaproteobacteria bacterium]|nr:hypothetical protein [Alphaproteobacteria bacterium]MBL7096205.1 hypothetical protein [Alphaproteobacteria bacterium]
MDIRAAAAPAFVRRGSVNAIGLEAIRLRIGARWEKVRESVHARLEMLLSHKLGPMDFFVRLNDSTYLITMPGSDGDDARLACMKISYELQKSLLGRCDLSDLTIARVCGEAGDTLELDALSEPELLVLAGRSGIDEFQAPCRMPSAAAKPVPEPAPIGFRFAPILDAAHQAITAYKLEICRHGTRRTMSAPTREEFKEELRDALAGIAHAAAVLSNGLRGGGRYLMVLPVSFDMLSAPAGRMEIAAACRSLSAELRPFLVFSIRGCPPGVPQSRLGDLIGSVRPFCRTVAVEFPSSSLDNPSYQNLGQRCLSFALPLAPSDRTRDDIVRLGAAAKRFAMTSFLMGVSTLDQAEQARNAGVTYLSGPIIGADVEIPCPMQRLSWEELKVRTDLRERYVSSRGSGSAAFVSLHRGGAADPDTAP